MTRTLDRLIEEFLRGLIIAELQTHEPHIQVVTSLMGEGEDEAALPRVVIQCQSQDTPEFFEVGVHRIVTQVFSIAEATSPVSSDDMEGMNTAVDRVIVFADNLPAYLSSADVKTHAVLYGGESQQTQGNKLIRVRSAEIWSRLLNASPLQSQVPAPVPPAWVSVSLLSYTVATVPTASGLTGAMIYITDEVGGAIPAFSDGTNWRRVTDRAIIT